MAAAGDVGYVLQEDEVRGAAAGEEARAQDGPSAGMQKRKRPSLTVLGSSAKTAGVTRLVGEADAKMLRGSAKVSDVVLNVLKLPFVPATFAGDLSGMNATHVRGVAANLFGVAKQCGGAGMYPVPASQDHDRPQSTPQQQPPLVTAGPDGARVWDATHQRMRQVRDPSVVEGELAEANSSIAALRTLLEDAAAAAPMLGAVFPLLRESVSVPDRCRR